MQKEYLLDTNAFFNLLKAINLNPSSNDALDKTVEDIRSQQLTISAITKVEIISVLGKYARGNQGGFQKCNCRISENGDLCQNSRYLEPRKKWSTRRTKAWMQLIDEILQGESKLLSVTVEPFNVATISEAQKIILHALLHNFASMDAMIAATAKIARENKRNITVITSDKGLKACLAKCDIPCLDLFAQ